MLGWMRLAQRQFRKTDIENASFNAFRVALMPHIMEAHTLRQLDVLESIIKAKVAQELQKARS